MGITHNVHFHQGTQGSVIFLLFQSSVKARMLEFLKNKYSGLMFIRSWSLDANFFEFPLNTCVSGKRLSGEPYIARQ